MNNDTLITRVSFSKNDLQEKSYSNQGLGLALFHSQDYIERNFVGSGSNDTIIEGKNSSNKSVESSYDSPLKVVQQNSYSNNGKQIKEKSSILGTSQNQIQDKVLQTLT